MPEQKWDTIASYGFDVVWLMGVWERSPAGIAMALRNHGLMQGFRIALTDFSAEDFPTCKSGWLAAAIDDQWCERVTAVSNANFFGQTIEHNCRVL